MNQRQLSRASYIAAHKILATDHGAPQLGCPGARRTAMVDSIARVIQDVFEAHSERFDAATDWEDHIEMARRQR